ncbi:hypothetical protein Z517_01029 [Fonsecaea pedrosoi CBS 271.37]|uniref:Uncharacterized protein n=1 Tax=Fonsecaea pedrosoi CBS 271.37 TaxID=1442368 RepID=A0A0D2FFZ9_9EURO|nr:uncharacterized protein Z517_01029 [Fonsecaea pedrosoi CBS 271.37]KIW85637.1 hypothetical protein Z517_01029 [Fonsecaea pedrosoi CBS 271.37]
MSESVEVWPPVGLINGLAIEAPTPEKELDANVFKGVHKASLPFVTWTVKASVDWFPIDLTGYFLDLPKGTEVISTNPSGTSAWVQTVCIEISQKDGRSLKFFKKAIHTYLPANVPKPIAWGAYRDDPDMYYYLAEFREMVADKVPDPVRVVDAVVQLYR